MEEIDCGNSHARFSPQHTRRRLNRLRSPPSGVGFGTFFPFSAIVMEMSSMRFLPYLLVGLMSVPLIVWTLLELFVLPTNATPFASKDLVKMGTLAVLALPAMGLLAWWMSRQIDGQQRQALVVARQSSDSEANRPGR